MDINEIINDLNVSIADLETFTSDLQPNLHIHTWRAIGCLKSARGNVLVVKRELAAARLANQEVK